MMLCGNLGLFSLYLIISQQHHSSKRPVEILWTKCGKLQFCSQNTPAAGDFHKSVHRISTGFPQRFPQARAAAISGPLP
jgi:hypothetical protein